MIEVEKIKPKEDIREMGFIPSNEWLYEKYFEKLNQRYVSFRMALDFLYRKENAIIVETGTLRMRDDWGGGCSTLIFGEFCKRNIAKLKTVDIKQENLLVSQNVTKEYAPYIEYIHRDSIQYLLNYVGKIDLLYLDSLDCNCDPKEANEIPQKHQLSEYQAAKKNLKVGSLVLLDDCQFENGGKCKMTKAQLKAEGQTLLLDSYQSLWEIKNI